MRTITIRSTQVADGIRRKLGDQPGFLDGQCDSFSVPVRQSDAEVALAIARRVQAGVEKWGPCSGLPWTPDRAQGVWHYATDSSRQGTIIWAE